MSTEGVAKFSVSMPVRLKKQVEDRVKGTALAQDRSSVLTRDLSRLYEGLFKQGIKTLRNAAFSAEERACLGTLLMSTAFLDPSHIPLLLFALEDAKTEMPQFGVDPEALLAKMRALDLAALYTLVDLIERDPSLTEIT